MKCNRGKVNNWQNALIDAVTDPAELLELLDIDRKFLPAAQASANIFSLKVPRGFVNRIEKGNINDPLLRQVLPIDAELEEVEGYSNDPLDETKYNPIPGLLHKYQGRVLLTVASVCGINCRYCFRRDFAYEKNNPGNAGWENALAYIAKDPTISEVILSGGDPLVANDSTLKNLTQKIAAIPHIKRLRIHSRMPIVLPERITSEFIDAVTDPRLKTIMVVHCNHSHELSPDVTTAMQLLADKKIVLLNQTVLLKGVNDNAETLIALSETLFAAGIQPYYLHVLDKVQGAAHFDLDRKIAQELHLAIAERLSGYLVPKLVCEQPGAPAKVAVRAIDFCTE